MENDSTSSAATPAVIQGKIIWKDGPSKLQNFSLPSSIIYYMLKNPSTPEVYNKLIQSCKYFFERNPILVAKSMDETSLCSRDKCTCKENCCVEVNIDKLVNDKFKGKIWLTRDLSLGDEITPDVISLLCSKLYYRSELDELILSDLKIMFDDFKALASISKKIYLSDVKMVYNDEKPVMFESFVEMSLNADAFNYTFGFEDFSMVTPATLKKILKLKTLGNLKKFSLNNIPQVFNVDDLSRLMKDYKDVKFGFEFSENISDEYKAELDTLIDTVIGSELPDRLIEYDGQNYEKLLILEGRYNFDFDSSDSDIIFGSDYDMLTDDTDMDDVDEDDIDGDDIDEDDIDGDDIDEEMDIADDDAY